MVDVLAAGPAQHLRQAGRGVTSGSHTPQGPRQPRPTRPGAAGKPQPKKRADTGSRRAGPGRAGRRGREYREGRGWQWPQAPDQWCRGAVGGGRGKRGETHMEGGDWDDPGEGPQGSGTEPNLGSERGPAQAVSRPHPPRRTEADACAGRWQPLRLRSHRGRGQVGRPRLTGLERAPHYGRRGRRRARGRLDLAESPDLPATEAGCEGARVQAGEAGARGGWLGERRPRRRPGPAP